VFVVTNAGGNPGALLTKMREVGDPNMVTVLNELQVGAIDIAVFKDDRQIALRTGISPGAESTFEVMPYLYIGTCVDVEEGDVMNLDTISGDRCKLNLLGVKSADIVMSGGGAGPNATAFVFRLDSQRY
jgi:hypothetical protein